jgi:hypothetical protein
VLFWSTELFSFFWIGYCVTYGFGICIGGLVIYPRPNGAPRIDGGPPLPLINSYYGGSLGGGKFIW